MLESTLLHQNKNHCICKDAVVFSCFIMFGKVPLNLSMYIKILG